MSEFEYSDNGSDDSDDEIIHLPAAKKKTPDINAIKIFRELRLYHANLFVDTFYLINSFIKSKQLTYNSFLTQFGTMNFHQIYAKPKGDVMQSLVSPHHYITTTQEALAVASKFLRSHSEKARIGALYLLYTLYKTQPLRVYPIRVKMEPKDYANTKKLVDKCFNEGLLHPAYCFYVLDCKKKIVISATAFNPCLETNFPRPEICKHMARVADKHFLTEYEEREDFNMTNKFRLIEQQIRREMTYINKLSNLSLGCNVGPEYITKLSKQLLNIEVFHEIDDKFGILKNEPDFAKKRRYKNSKNIAFPGVNEDILEDMVTTVKSPEYDEITNNCYSRIKQKLNRKRKRGRNRKKNTLQAPVIKQEPGLLPLLPKLSSLINSDSNSSSINSDEYPHTEDSYEDMIWRLIESSHA